MVIECEFKGQNTTPLRKRQVKRKQDQAEGMYVKTAQFFKIGCKPRLKRYKKNSLMHFFLHKYTNNLQVSYEKKKNHNIPNEQARQPHTTEQKVK